MLVATGASPAEQSDDPEADTESRAFCSSSTSPTAGMPRGSGMPAPPGFQLRMPTHSTVEKSSFGGRGCG